MLARQSLGVVAMLSLEKGGDSHFRAQQADFLEIWGYGGHRLMEARSVGEFLICLCIHCSLLLELGAKAQQAAESGAGSQTNDLADPPVVEYTSEDGRLARAPCEMAHDATWGDAVGSAEHKVNPIHQRSNVVRVEHDVQSVGDHRLLRPAMLVAQLEAVDLVSSYAVGSENMADHVVPKESVRVHKLETSDPVPAEGFRGGGTDTAAPD